MIFFSSSAFLDLVTSKTTMATNMRNAIDVNNVTAGIGLPLEYTNRVLRDRTLRWRRYRNMLRCTHLLSQLTTCLEFLNNTQTVELVLSKNFLFWFGERLSVTSEKGKAEDNNRAVPKPRNSPQDHHQLICSGN